MEDNLESLKVVLDGLVKKGFLKKDPNNPDGYSLTKKGINHVINRRKRIGIV